MTHANQFPPGSTSSSDARDERVYHCTLCGSSALEELVRYSTYLDLRGHTDARVRRCTQCSMTFLEPYPIDLLEKIYAENYFVPDEVNKWSADSGAPLDYTDMALGRMPKFQATIELLKRYVPTPARLMDIGAATGEFADIARRNGYDVSGIELSEYAAAQAKKRFHFDFFVGPLEAYPNTAPFDVIHLSHVLEHLVDVHASIEKMNSMLSDKGVIYIEVPFGWNLAERFRQALGRVTPFTVWSIHHRSMFQPKTLRAFFAKHGFKCCHLTVAPRNRYPSNSLASRTKEFAWKILAGVNQGLLIEAVFSRDD